jgi:hypothetical protein
MSQCSTPICSRANQLPKLRRASWVSPGGAGGNRAPLLGIAGFLPFVIASPSAEGRGNLLSPMYLY